MGDYSTNAAMMLAKPLGRPPREIAVEIAEAIEGYMGEEAVKTEIAGPGFINLFLRDGWYRAAVGFMSVSGAATHDSVASPERIIVEIVSANPT